MLIPLHDANALKHIRAPYVTRLLILVNFAVYALLAPDAMAELGNRATLVFGFIPALVTHHVSLPAELQLISPDASYITYAFLHGSFMHVGLNMLFLYIFGDNVEDAMGHFRFLAFYLACAAAGAFVHQILTTDPEAPLIGASGAISGVIVAYALLHPHVRLWVLVLFGIPLPLPAFVPLVFWVGQQFYSLLFSGGEGVSFAAHVGGIIAGGLLVLVLRRRGVPLFDRALLPHPDALKKRVDAMAQTDDNDSGPDQKAEEGPRWGR